MPSLPSFYSCPLPRIFEWLSIWLPSEGSETSPFFCSNRGRHLGCGRTFSLLWSHLLPATSLSPEVLLGLIDGVCKSVSVHHVWFSGGFPFSYSTALRWWKRWLISQSHIRSLLARVIPPPRMDAAPALKTWTYLQAAYSSNHARSFQEEMQRPLFLRLS